MRTKKKSCTTSTEKTPMKTELKTINAWASSTKIDRRTLAKRLAQSEPDATDSRGYSLYSANTITEALAAAPERTDGPVIGNLWRLVAEQCEDSLFNSLAADAGQWAPAVLVDRLGVSEAKAKEAIAHVWLLMASRYSDFRHCDLQGHDAMAEQVTGRRHVSQPADITIEWPDWMQAEFKNRLPENPAREWFD